MDKLTPYTLPTVFIVLVFSAAYFWGTMGIIGVLALTAILTVFGYLFKEI